MKIVCALPGLTTGYGPSHQATEDLAIFRGMPNLRSSTRAMRPDIEQATQAIANHPGPVYMRLLRGNVPVVLDRHDYRFEIGRAKLLRDGADALVISSGLMTMRALEAADILAAQGVSIAVLHSPTIKPLDEATILAQAGREGVDRLLWRKTIRPSVALGSCGRFADAQGGPQPVPSGCTAGRVPRRGRVADPA